MPYTKSDLQTLYSLEQSDVTQTLAAAKLTIEQSTYTDEEIQLGFDVIRGYFSSGQANDYTVASELFEQGVTVNKHAESKSETPTKKPKSKKSTWNISELRRDAIESTKTQIRLTDVIQIMELCGLSPDQEQYNKVECDRFLMACDLILNQSKSPDEVAAHFGYSTELNASLEQSLVQNLDEAADLIESNVSSISDEMIQQRASGQALADTQRYLAYYVQAVRSGQETQEFWHRLRTHAKTRLEGKAQARLNRATEPTPLILPFSPSSMNSSENSENGTTDE